MKHLILAAFLAIGLAGCASEYLIITDDGTVHTSEGKPYMDSDSGLLEFEDSDGRKHQIPQNTVRSVIER